MQFSIIVAAKTSEAKGPEQIDVARKGKNNTLYVLRLTEL